MDGGELRWLVRHAQSVGNAAGIVQGQRRRIGLSPLGRLQATRLAADFALVEWGEPPLVVSSDLRRAVETARPIARRLGAQLQTERALRERSFGVLEGSPWSEAVDKTGLRDGRIADPHARPRRGESIHDVQLRATAFLDSLLDKHRDRPLIVVAHGGTIRVLRAHQAGEPLAGLPWRPVPNAVRAPLFAVSQRVAHPPESYRAGQRAAPISK